MCGIFRVQDFNLEITPGQSVIVTGANGAGKTSMFRVLAVRLDSFGFPWACGQIHPNFQGSGWQP